tara:strand:- start:339 stop:716 length:378 start_codon:yes stop_codon:yes gene_type:complete
VNDEDEKIVEVQLGDDKPYTVTYSTGGASTISDPTYTLTSSDLTDTLDMGGGQTTFAPSYHSSIADGEISFGGIDSGVQSWPTEYRIEEMVKKYPALKIAYLKFKEVYDLVKDDYANGDDDEIPF